MQRYLHYLFLKHHQIQRTARSRGGGKPLTNYKILQFILKNIQCCLFEKFKTMKNGTNDSMKHVCIRLIILY